MGCCKMTLIVMATGLGPITLVFMSVSFGTDFWLRYEVDRSKLTQNDKLPMHDRYSHTRDRGIFRECYSGNDTVFLEGDPDVVDDKCYKVDFETPDITSDKSEEYLVRIHLIRLFLAFFVIALVFFIASFVFGLILCCYRVSRWAYLAGIFAYISAFSVAAGIAFFHGAEYLERNKMDDDGFYMRWPDNIKNATTRSYGWSYALGWVAMILATLTATFYSVAGCMIASSRYEDREHLNKDHSYRNGRDYPMAMDPRYLANDPYLVKPQPVYATGSPYAYNGPYMVADPATSLYSARPPPPEEWAIREISG